MPESGDCPSIITSQHRHTTRFWAPSNPIVYLSPTFLLPAGCSLGQPPLSATMQTGEGQVTLPLPCLSLHISRWPSVGGVSCLCASYASRGLDSTRLLEQSFASPTVLWIPFDCSEEYSSHSCSPSCTAILAQSVLSFFSSSSHSLHSHCSIPSVGRGSCHKQISGDREPSADGQDFFRFITQGCTGQC